MHWLPSTQAKQDWKNDVRQASGELQAVITTITALATAAELGKSYPNDDMPHMPVLLVITTQN